MQLSATRELRRTAVDALLRLSRTRANYWAEFALDTTLGVTFLLQGLRYHDRSWSEPLLVLAGLFVFSYIEYFFHRWLFHGPVRLLAEGHAAHHRNPLGYDALPFFLPSLLLFGLIAPWLVLLPLGDALLISCGIAFGYIAYGAGHFAIHRLRMRHPVLRRWAGYHHIHHYHPDRNFGVTSPLWDSLLGTRYASARRPARRAPMRSVGE